MNDDQVRPHRYSYWCVKCKRKIPSTEIKREVLDGDGDEEDTDPSSDTENKRTVPVCPYCETRIKRNYKVWCNFCERTVKASDLIPHRTLLGNIIHLCPYCELDRTVIKEKKDTSKEP